VCSVSTKALKTIDKYGGLDSYILWNSEKELDSDFGMKLKKKILANCSVEQLVDEFGSESVFGKVGVKRGILTLNESYLSKEQKAALCKIN
jgi:hypothetical protein